MSECYWIIFILSFLLLLSADPILAGGSQVYFADLRDGKRQFRREASAHRL